MAIPISCFAGVKMLVSKPFLEQTLLDSLMAISRQNPQVDSVVKTPSFCHSSDGVVLTNDLSELNPEDEVLFYHPIKGFMLAYQQYDWDWSTGQRVPAFSTMTFLQNLKRAESSVNVTAHFLHINSGGGEAWMLDIAAAAMRECKKPIYAFIEGCCCSAAYYLAANAQVIKTFTQNDIVGSVGTMATFLDVSGWLEQLGLKKIEQYATKSDLKNKKERDVLEGHPEQFIKTILDPVQAQFEASIKAGRKQLAALDEDHPALRGETFMASEAVKVGLIDGVLSDFNQALSEAAKLGADVKASNSLLTKL